jgi:hypothetical protein
LPQYYPAVLLPLTPAPHLPPVRLAIDNRKSPFKPGRIISDGKSLVNLTGGITPYCTRKMLFVTEPKRRFKK